MSPGWLPADWTVDADGICHMALRPPLPIGEALILRDLLVTTSCERQWKGNRPR